MTNNLIPMVIDNANGTERSYDIFSRMLEDRVIFINGPVTEAMSSIVCAQLLYLEAKDAVEDIYIYINSPGGSVTAGMAIYDTMQYIKNDVVTIVMGQACSMGSVFLMGGTKGKRYALPHSRIMIHQVSSGTQGQATDMQIALEEVLKLKKMLTGLYVIHTGKTYKSCHAAMERDNFMSPEEAKNFGLIDEIIEHAGDIK